MTNFTKKMTLTEFQVKQHIFKYIAKISANERYLQTLGTSGKYDQIKESENQQRAQGLASFCYFHQNICFFPVCFSL